MEITLNQVSLWVQQTQLVTGRVQGENAILSSITATLGAGQLHAVMGPSGCGKTSLINLICERLFHNRRQEGSVLFNGLTPGPILPLVCAYVQVRGRPTPVRQ